MMTILRCTRVFTTLTLTVFATQAIASKPRGISAPASQVPLNHVQDEDLEHAQDLGEASYNPVVEVIPAPTKEAPRAKIGAGKSKIVSRARVAVVEQKPSAKGSEPGGNKTGPNTQTSKAETSLVPNDAPTGEKEVVPEVNQAAMEVTQGVKVEDIVDLAETYEYAGRDKDDPFVPPMTSFDAPTSSSVKSLDADEIPIVSPLQYYAIKALIVTGVWQSEDSRWKAMVETPDQQGIITKYGDPIGNSGGHVADIGPNGIKVREYTIRKDGTREFTDHVISLIKESEMAIPANASVGGKIILKPGSSTPEVIPAEQSVEVVPEVPAKPQAEDISAATPLASGKDAVPKDAPESDKKVLSPADIGGGSQQQMQAPALQLLPGLSPFPGTVPVVDPLKTGIPGGGRL